MHPVNINIQHKRKGLFMEKDCLNPLPEDELSKMSPLLAIALPPKDNGEHPLFRVVYIIDVNACDAQEAADYTHRIMSDPASMPPILHVFDHEGNCTIIDLSEDKEP